MKARYLMISTAIVAADQWTKWLVETNLPLHGSRELIPGVLELSHVRNTGVAFGLFAARGDGARTALLALFGLVALTLIGYYFVRTPREHRRLLWALALVLGGAVGNLADRLASGAVTDFVAVFIGSYRWPDFNLADSAISVGLVLLLIDAFSPRHARPAPEPG